MAGDRALLTNLLFGHVVDELSADAYIAGQALWAVDLYAASGEMVPLLSLQPPGDTVVLPSFTALPGQADLPPAIETMRDRIRHDIAQLSADALHARDPLLVLLVSGLSPVEEAGVGAALDVLRAESLRPGTGRSWAPAILLVGMMVDDLAPLTRIVRSRDGVGMAIVGRPDDAGQAAAYIGDLARGSLTFGVSPLRYAAWIVAIPELRLGAPDDDGSAAVLDVPGVAVEPDGLTFVRRSPSSRFTDLLDVVSVRGRPAQAARPGFPDGRALWPVRLVVDRPGSHDLVGLLEPGMPAGFPRTLLGIHDDPGAEPVSRATRALLCAHLAETVALAHEAGMMLGDRAIHSARYRVAPDPAVLLTDCRAVLPARPHGREADLRTLAHLIERVVGTTGMPNTGGPLRAADWRDHLLVWAAAPEGPPVIDSFEAHPLVLQSGAEVELRWRCRQADSLIIVGPDGIVVTPDSADLTDGTARMLMTKPGAVNLYAVNKGGRDEASTAWINVIPRSMPTDIRVPFPIRPATGNDL